MIPVIDGHQAGHPKRPQLVDVLVAGEEDLGAPRPPVVLGAEVPVLVAKGSHKKYILSGNVRKEGGEGVTPAM